MTIFLRFVIITLLFYFYLTRYLKIDVGHILDTMHSAFLRQLTFELIPFIIFFGMRDTTIITFTSVNDFFNSIIGRSLVGMIGFTMVSYVLSNTPKPKKDEKEKQNNIFNPPSTNNVYTPGAYSPTSIY